MTNHVKLFHYLLCFGFLLPSAGLAQSNSQTTASSRTSPNDQVPCLLQDDQNLNMRNLRPQTVPALIYAQGAEIKASGITVPRGSPADYEVQKAKAQKETLRTYAQILRQRYSSASASTLKRNMGSIIENAIDQTLTPTGLQELKVLPEDLATVKTLKGDVKAASQEAADQVSSTLSPFQRPDNVGCSMSVLSWNEAHKALGRTIADTYLVVQITVRNLDSDNEFLIHDAELAVDANGAQLSRFQVGHEKELARSVLQYGQVYDRQHVFITVVDGIGTILGAIVGIPQPSVDGLTGSTGAWHAGLTPFMHALFPDLTTRNLNTLNDLAFSAANASRVVVPKAGSVPFIVFIPVQPLEQACWLQKDYDIYKDSSPSAPCEQICKDGRCTSEKLRRVKIGDWTPVQMQALEKHAFALVAGVHIRALSNQGSNLDGITCNAQADTSGTYYQPSIAASGLICSLKGTDLDTLQLLRLRSPDDPNTNLDAKVTVSGDNTAAIAILAASDAANLKHVQYELFGVDKAGNEHDLNRILQFRQSPLISAGQTIPASGSSFTLNGSNLAGVSQVVFFDSTDKNKQLSVNVLSIASAGDSLVAALPSTAALPNGTYTIQVVLGDVANTQVDTKTTVTR